MSELPHPARSGRASAPVDLSLDALLSDARAAAALEDFGEARHGAVASTLAPLLATYDGAMNLTERGRRSTRRRLLGLLVNRLRVVETLARHPEILERPIVKPMFLTGLPRTGTSALFNLLASDPDARPLLLWEGNHPDPLDVPPGAEDPRLVALRDGLARARAANPDFAAIHDARADGPEECVQLLAHSMGFVQTGVEALYSPYRESFLGQDFGPAYTLYADLLRLLDWQRPGKRWLLKTPAHLWALDELVRLFPDATIVVSHRDPRESIGSYCSMVRALLIDSQDVDARALGPRVLENLAESMRRAMAVRDTLDAARFVDVDYAEFVTDPLATALRIHHHAQLPTGDAVQSAMRAHVAAHPRNRHGEHRYSLDEYGLDESTVLATFAPYLARHPVANR